MSAPLEADQAVLARAARAVAAAERPGDALAAVVSAIRGVLRARGAALLRTERDRLVPVASDGLAVGEHGMDEASLTPVDGGGYPLVLAGRVEGVLLLADVEPATLASQERVLAGLLDLAAVALRNARLTEEQVRDRQERELRSLERLSRPPATGVTAASFGFAPLRVGQAARFGELAEHYGALLDRALEQRAYAVDHRLSDSLRELAEALGFLRAGPRDVVELHTTALKARTAAVGPSRAQAYVEEGRLMVLELMGYLTAYYRSYTVGSIP